MKKEFELPKLIIVLFSDEDIITGSGPEDDPNGEEGGIIWPPLNP